MIRTAATALALMLAPAARAQELSPDQFQARTEGHAFGTYFADGTLQGIEIFLRDRRVVWQDAAGTCQSGLWQVQNGYVCYLYEDSNPGYCLQYRTEADTIIGRADTGEEFTLRLTSKNEVTCPMDEPLLSHIETGAALLPVAERAAP